jgi:hypothetical protein
LYKVPTIFLSSSVNKGILTEPGKCPERNSAGVRTSIPTELLLKEMNSFIVSCDGICKTEEWNRI